MLGGYSTLGWGASEGRSLSLCGAMDQRPRHLTMDNPMRRAIYTFLFALVALTFATSCRKNKDYVNSLPADATLVGTIQLDKLLQKAEITNVDKRASLATYLGGWGSAELSELFERAARKPKDTGLDLEEPIYAFTTSDGVSALVVRVADRGDVKDFLTKLLGRTASGESALEDKGDYYVCRFGEEDSEGSEGGSSQAVAFDKHRFLWLSAPSAEVDLSERAGALLAQSAESSFTAKPAYKSLTEAAADLVIYMRPYTLASGEAEDVPEEGELSAEELGQIGTLTTINFESGRIEGRTQTLCDDEGVLKRYTDLLARISPRTIEGTFAGYLPQYSLLTLQSHQNLYLSYRLNRHHRLIGPRLEQIAEALHIDLGYLTHALEGDIALSVESIPAGNDKPRGTLYIASGEATSADALYDGLRARELDQAEEERPTNPLDFTTSDLLSPHVQSLGEHTYRTTSLSGLTSYFGTAQSALYLTLGEEGRGRLFTPAVPSVKESSDYANMLQSHTYLYVDIERLLHPEGGVTELLSTFAPADFLTQLRQLRSFTYQRTGLESSFALQLSSQGNALATLINLVTSLPL